MPAGKRTTAPTAVKSRIEPSNRNLKEAALFEAYLQGASIRKAAAQLGIPKTTATLIIKKLSAANGNKLPPKAPAASAPEPVINQAPKKAWRGTHVEYPTAGHITRVQHLPFDQLFPELDLGEVRFRQRAA